MKEAANGGGLSRWWIVAGACDGASLLFLTTWHAVTQGSSLLRRQASRNLAHDLHNLQHDDITISAGSTFEQIADRGADLCLGVVSIAKTPIELI
jgi:hypothetical protein